jgi:hypothetical protein
VNLVGPRIIGASAAWLWRSRRRYDFDDNAYGVERAQGGDDAAFQSRWDAGVMRNEREPNFDAPVAYAYVIDHSERHEIARQARVCHTTECVGDLIGGDVGRRRFGESCHFS